MAGLAAALEGDGYAGRSWTIKPMTAIDLDAGAPGDGAAKGPSGDKLDPAVEKFLAELCQALAAAEAGEEGVRLTTRRAGPYAEVAKRFNALTHRQTELSKEMARVARAAGREGKLTERVELHGAGGLWAAAAGSVNGLIDDLVRPTNEVARVISAVADGDLSQKMALQMDGHPVKGEFQRIGRVVNSMVDQLRSFADEVTRVAREVGTEGRLGGQADVHGASGTWKDLTDSVNVMASNLTDQVRNIALVTTAVANGDLSQKITVDARGEISELKNTINTMVDQLGSFADEVTRVAREVGTEGKLGGQAEVRGVSGTWKDLTVSVNSMADNLTDQVRNIAQVTTAVAQGDLSQKITVDARGEIFQLKSTINKMVDQLSAFAAEVTRVAREVGTEGRLGGQAEVEGVSGTWKRLTESVNQLASNLTTQVRSIADVATAVTQGDLTRTITVDAAGEVGDLKDNINQMIVTLRETTRSNQDQDWLKSNLARIGAMLQGHRDLRALSQLIMSELTPLVTAQQGAFFMADPGSEGDDCLFRLIAGYGYRGQNGLPTEWRTGEGLVGQAALEKKSIVVDVPSGAARISTGLTEAEALNVVVLPVVFEDQVLAVMELASFKPFSGLTRAFLDQIVETVGIVLNTIVATMRTEELLAQSQSLTRELRSQSDELQRQQRELQHTNAEIELARRELEERAEQLALSSRYKSEFLANMSHELRTPLNSLLILAKLLAENTDGSLSDRHVEFATSIYDAGNDLLSLISDILDLSKVEAGKMDVAIAPVLVQSLCDDLEHAFRPIADQQALNFVVSVDHGAPESITTDEHRVQQVLKNLLSNALKFTEAGTVSLHVGRAPAGTRFTNARLASAGDVVVFSVSDTGIGIKPDQLMVIFEAFQQADGTTSRRYGGTGLGLSISREIALLLGGEIQVTSTPGEGSTFSLLLPVTASVASTPAPPTPAPSLPPALAAERSAAPFGAIRAASAPVADVAGRKLLMVDDDVRNLYALTSALEDHGLEVVCADSARLGIELLTSTPGLELVLMDIMMPDMDGLEAIRRIRGMDGFADLPIVALTAKAMRGDREESLAAGASDYVTKPVDLDQLLDTLRVWLHR